MKSRNVTAFIVAALQLFSQRVIFPRTILKVDSLIAD